MALLLLAGAAESSARTLTPERAIDAAQSRAAPGEFVSECDRVSRVRMACWLLSPGGAEIVDDESGEVAPAGIEIAVSVFYRRGRLYTYVPLIDDRAVAVRRLLSRRVRLAIQRAAAR